MQYIRCPVCNSEFNNKEVEKYKEYTLYWCTACDLQWWHPMESPKASVYEERHVLRDTFSFATELAWDHWQFFRYLPKGRGRLLDIGCGTGRFLYEIKRQGLALQPTGLDFDRNAVEVAKSSFKLDNVFAMSLEEFCAKHSEGGFDIVTLFQVLEHQGCPVDFLERVRELLVPNGYLVLGVPNRNTWGGPFPWDYPPEHFTRWSTKALSFFLRKGGFSVVLLQEAPCSLPEARALFSYKIDFLGSLEDTTTLGFKKIAKETQDLNSHLVRNRLARTAVSLLRLLRKGILFTPALFLCTLGRASSKNGVPLFCIARKERN